MDGFLTKQSIIRKSTLSTIDCPNDNLVVSFGLSNSKFDIFKKNNLISIAQRNSTISEIDFEKNSRIELVYDDIVTQNTRNQFYRDTIVFFSLFSVILFKLYNKKGILKAFLLRYFKSIFKEKNKEISVSQNDLNYRNNTYIASYKNSTLVPIHESTIGEMPRNYRGLAQKSCNSKSFSTSNITRIGSNETRKPICIISQDKKKV